MDQKRLKNEVFNLIPFKTGQNDLSTISGCTHPNISESLSKSS